MRHAFQRLGLFGKTILPVALLTPAAIVILLIYVSASTERTTINSMVERAKDSIGQFKTLRAYYTRNIVKKVKDQQGMAIGIQHKEQANMIPLPATMIHDLSEEFAKANSKTLLNLYSAFPFPNRKDRVLDDFQKAAIEHFKSQPDEPFVRTMSSGKAEEVRVAIADKMVDQSCVDCHNAHPQSPFKQWKVGDVRGILEVRGSIAPELAESRSMMKMIGWTTVGMLILLIAMIAAIIKKFVLGPTTAITATLAQTADATLAKSSVLRDVSAQGSKASINQAAAIQESVSTLDEINAMVARGVTAAGKTAELSKSSLQAATDGNEVIAEMTKTMVDINSSNAAILSQVQLSHERMGEIITIINGIKGKTEVINEIVVQTRLLSFNASVEAARAGEHGKGFAVVAEEVGALAKMSGVAAEEIAAMLNSSDEKVRQIVDESKTEVTTLTDSSKAKVQRGIKMSERCSQALSALTTNVNEVDRMMNDLTEASREQATAINNIATAMNQLDGTTQETASIANQTEEHANALTTQANALREAVHAIEGALMGARRAGKMK